MRLLTLPMWMYITIHVEESFELNQKIWIYTQKSPKTLSDLNTKDLSTEKNIRLLTYSTKNCNNNEKSRVQKFYTYHIIL